MDKCRVPHTCKYIDSVISELDEIESNINSLQLEEGLKDAISILNDTKIALYDIKSKKGTLETIREANESLRNWGQECYDYANEIESEKSDLEYDNSQKDSKISELERENEKLENKIDYLTQVIIELKQ